MNGNCAGAFWGRVCDVAKPAHLFVKIPAATVRYNNTVVSMRLLPLSI